ncbi:MAG: acetyl-CoA carboxylase carboxyl transferase subunit alpha [Clostridiales bacterium]|nr:acetyl-CoA carboxylase carboxyl transferase subunit alpha [Clostridiales bacterium]
MTAYERVQAARAKGRPTALYYIQNLLEGFVELHGDRRFGDDPAIVAGIGMLNGLPITAIGIEKGVATADKVRRNFGMAQPEGYRKALRQMLQAQKFGRPVLTLIDTSGAYCGIGAEERGQGQAIAENLTAMAGLRVPLISVIVGEGGSGGALALAMADRVWMLSSAVYSVISPEGAASIIWKDAKRTREASECLKLTADDLVALKVVDRVLDEEQPADQLLAQLKDGLAEEFAGLAGLDAEELLGRRYDKFRRMGADAP